jgi:hypothetical protein
LRRFKINDSENSSPNKASILGYFNVVNPKSELLHLLETVKKDLYIEIEKDSGKTLNTYGFTELKLSGSYADCANLGYLLNAAVDTVIFRSKPFTTMAAGYELRKK